MLIILIDQAFEINKNGTIMIDQKIKFMLRFHPGKL